MSVDQPWVQQAREGIIMREKKERRKCMLYECMYHMHTTCMCVHVCTTTCTTIIII